VRTCAALCLHAHPTARAPAACPPPARPLPTGHPGARWTPARSSSSGRGAGGAPAGDDPAPATTTAARGAPAGGSPAAAAAAAAAAQHLPDGSPARERLPPVNMPMQQFEVSLEEVLHHRYLTLYNRRVRFSAPGQSPALVRVPPRPRARPRARRCSRYMQAHWAVADAHRPP
jgi:hypothetical protein